MSGEEPVRKVKVVFLGQSGVGKSSIIARFLDNPLPNSTTISCAYAVKQLQNVYMMLFDTAGQERFDSLTSLYYRNTDFAVLVYARDDSASLSKIDYWKQQLLQNADQGILLLVVENKADLPSGVSLENAMVCSALNNTGIQEVFEKIVYYSNKLDKGVVERRSELDMEYSSEVKQKKCC